MSKDNKQQNTQPPEEPAKEVPETEETSCPEGNPSQAPLPEETPEPSELEKAQAEIERLNDQLLRTLAEYDNYRKRTAKEKEQIYSDAKIATVKEFLAVYDNLERAVAQGGDEDSPHKKGMEMIFHQFEEILQKMGVEKIDAVGQTFDPEKHSAVMHIEDETLGENTVAEAFQQGFTLHGKVLRFAVVKVAN